MIIIEILKVFLTSVFEFGKTFINIIYNISGIPTTTYGLVQFLVEKDYYVLSGSFTKILLFITPLIVSHIIIYLFDLFRLRGIKEKEILSIILYISILYLFTSWIFWTIIGCIVIFVIIISIINLKNDGYSY